MMRKDLTIENCPRCGRSHRYVIDVTVVEVSETIVNSRPIGRNRLLQCPDTQKTFEHRIMLDLPPGTRVLDVSVQPLLAGDEQGASDRFDTKASQPQAFSDERPGAPDSSGVRDEGQRESRIFISYSRLDKAIVTPIVHILRAVGLGVFHDVDSISYGKRWRPVIEDSINLSTVVVVFWCEHARQSTEVRKEWQFAIQCAKDLVPMLLDATPLEDDLAEFQALDLRSLVSVHEGRPANASRMFDDLTNAPHRTVLLPEVAEAMASRVIEFLSQRSVAPM